MSPIMCGNDISPLFTLDDLENAFQWVCTLRKKYSSNSDIWWEEDPASQDIIAELNNRWDDKTMDGLLVVVRRKNALFFEGPGDFEILPEGRLTPRGTAPTAPYIYTGIQLIHPDRLLNGRTGPFALFECYVEAASKGRLYGLELQGQWSDVGTPQALEGLEEYLKTA